MQDQTLDSDSAEPLLEKNHQVSLISRGPPLHEVASRLLRRLLAEHYPDLAIDPDKAMVGSPQWQVIDEQIERGPVRYQSLTLALMHHATEGTTADYVEGAHFLTLEPQADNPLQLPVDIEDIARNLNEAAKLLFVELQDRQLNYWNEKDAGTARWQALADSLHKALNVKQVKGWDADECALARAVFANPDNETRKNAATGFSDLQACLIDVDIIEKETPRHLLIGGALVICAEYRGRQMILMYTMDYGYESFGTLEQLGNTLPERLDLKTGASLEWRLFEPEGNIFDHMAMALVASQIDSIGALSQSGEFAASTDPDAGLNAVEQARYKTLDVAIPDWLRNAAPADLDDYRRYITALGKLYRKPAHQLAKTEIPSIERYAHQAMRDAIVADKSALNASTLPWEDLRIKITNSFTVGDFTLPNPHDQHTETLAEFALENDAPYMASLSFENGEEVPSWLTPPFLTEVAAKVDVGLAYPAMIKEKLIDDPITSARQASFHREQLRWLLPLKALEGKIRQQSGIDERGYQFVCKWLDPASDTADSIAVYPLAMRPQHRVISTRDTVTNMFIISPRETPNGPCLLYRPLENTPLLQFPSRQNLLYALHQPGELRESVIAWLPNKTLSFEYSQYVFPVGLPSPWLVVEQLIDPLLRAEKFGRVTLDLREVSGDVRSALFKRNALALVALADRQSQSNAERRWKLLKDSSWALFGVASNFLSGAVGAAVWAWQIIEQIQQGVDAHERGDTFIQWKSETDILLALGILLSHHVVMRRQQLARKTGISRETPAKLALPSAATLIALDSNPLVGELPFTHRYPVEAAGVVPRLTPSALVTYLDALQVTPPGLSKDPADPQQNTPRYLHHFAKKTYAKVGKRWFEVAAEEDGAVHILDAGKPDMSGPLLASDHDGRWTLDLRLRLRGGGPKSRIKALRAANELRKTELRKALDKFQQKKRNPGDQEGDEEVLQKEVGAAQTDYFAATDDNRESRSVVYVNKLEAMIKAYQQSLSQLKEWHSLGGGPAYVNDSLRTHGELHKYLSLWFIVKKHAYVQITNALRADTVINETNRTAYLERVRQATDLSHAMVAKLTVSEDSFEALQTFGAPGVLQVHETRKLMPAFTQWDIKANEIGIAQSLCVDEHADTMVPQAHDDVGDLLVRGSAAAHRVSRFLKENPSESDPPQRIEALSELIETFADVDQRLGELPDTYPGFFNQTQLDHLRALVGEFATQAQTLRASLLEEDQSALTLHPDRPSTSKASRQTIKVRKTRPRQATRAEAAPLAEALGVIRLDERQPTPALEDSEIISAGLNLVDDAADFIKRTLKDALRPSRIPADMQDILDQQARKLDECATHVDQVLSRTKEFPVGSLAKELRAAAVKMRASAKTVRTSLYKLRKPTQAALRWLHDNEQIDVRRDQGRIRTKQMGDYFQEYRIVDKTNKDQTFWVAHFHYRTLNSPRNSPTAAHLKVSETYLKTLSGDLQKTLSAVEPVDGVLRKIDDPELRKLFFDLEPQDDTADAVMPGS